MESKRSHARTPEPIWQIQTLLCGVRWQLTTRVSERAREPESLNMSKSKLNPKPRARSLQSAGSGARETEMQAYSKVIALLEPFPDEAKLRIIKATAILLGMPPNNDSTTTVR